MNPLRRRFSSILLASPLLLMASRSRANSDQPRTLSFDHTHTGKSLTITYAYGDNYLPSAMKTIDYFLRDFRTEEIHAIDPQLLDQLHLLSSITATRAAFEVISAYRSPDTNRLLRSHRGGVASRSMHLEGRAIDIRLADVSLTDLRDAAVSMGTGGVGFYPDSNFIHIDTGRVRQW